MAFLTAKEIIDTGLVYSIAGAGGAITAEKKDERYIGAFWVFGALKGEADCDSIDAILDWIDRFGAKCIHTETVQ